MRTRLLAPLVAGLSAFIVSGPVLAGGNQAQRQGTCDAACARTAEAMANQQTKGTQEKSSENGGTEKSSQTFPSYLPLELLDFFQKCCAQPWKL